jgi:predicted nucleic acid-binding protein
LLEQVVGSGEHLVTDAEVLQEILQRYVAINRRDAIQPAFTALPGIADDVYPIEARDLDRAKNLVLGAPHLSARDAVHVAVMQRHGVERILSFDRGFDAVPGIQRLG